jgi:hypothetical protein
MVTDRAYLTGQEFHSQFADGNMDVKALSCRYTVSSKLLCHKFHEESIFALPISNIDT